ncbi:MAG TPA: pilus assembly protein TadG-related protein [Verrucomicrobiae bacterium]|nr:pilus assembly protein TadG-related protein [Verrucomicrobiae bacterium]
MLTGSDARLRGQVLPAFAILLGLVLLPIAGLAVDGGTVLEAHADLLGVAEAAAQGGADALDVRRLEATGIFQLCTVPDDPTGCGNGIGSADLVLGRIIAAADLGGCRPLPGAPPGDVWETGPPPAPAGMVGSGCAYAFLAGCASGLGSQARSTYAPAAPAEVRVYLWRAVALHLLALLGFRSVEVTATGVALLAHGFGSATPSRPAPAGTCS